MNRFSKNVKGFTVVEALLIILVIAVIGFGGYYVWHTQHTKSTTKTTASTKLNPYAGWKTYTLKKERLSFKYPSNWAIKSMSDASNDYILLNGTNGFEMTIGAGSEVSAVENYPASCIGQSDKVTFVNRTAYLDFITVDQFNSNCTPVSNPATIGRIFLSDSSQEAAHNDFFPTKNLTSGSNPAIIVSMDYFGPNFTNQNNYKTVSFIENDVNYEKAKLVIDSMAY